MATTTMPRIITFQAAAPKDDQTTPIPPHLENAGPLIQYLQTPPAEAAPPPTTEQSNPTKSVFEVGRDRSFSTGSWIGKALFRAVWNDPGTLQDKDKGKSNKSTKAAKMQKCEIIVRLAKEDPQHPDMPAVLLEMFQYFVNVLTVDGDDENALQHLTVRFLWGSSDWDNLGDIPVSCQYALEPLLGLQKGPSILELEGVEPEFAGRFAKGLTGREEVMPRYAAIAPGQPDYAEMERKGEPQFDWEDMEMLSGREKVRKTLVFDVAGDRES